MKTRGGRHFWVAKCLFPGDGTLTGTFVDQNDVIIPGRRVAVLERATMLQVALTVCDATSAWSVTGVDLSRKYVPVATDPAEGYNAGRHDNITPV